LVAVVLESKEMLVDDLQIYSNGLINALKQDKLIEARGYVADLTGALNSASNYLDSEISYLKDQGTPTDAEPLDAARTEADRAVMASKRADEKAERLTKAARDTNEEAKRLKKAADKSKKEAAKARKAAKKAKDDERKAEKHAHKAAEHAGKANRAARES
jgi:hypothetical protein